MMSLQALCCIKLLVIFSIFECYVCYQAIFQYTSLFDERHKIINEFSLAQEPSTFIAVISKCKVFGNKTEVTYFKVLASDNTTSRLIEILAKHTKNFGALKNKYQFEIQSRGDFDVNTCSEITIPVGDCVIYYGACERNLGTTYRGTGLYTKTDHCVGLLKKLGYVKIDYEKTQTEGICPLTDIEILLLAPNMNPRSDYRALATLQLHSVLPLLKMELRANNKSNYRVELTDGPHMILNNNRVLEFYANMIIKGTINANYRIERVFNADGEPTISLRDPVGITPSDAIRNIYT